MGVADLRAGLRPRLAIYGPAEEGTEVSASVRRHRGAPVDATNPGDLRFRLVVLEPQPGSDVLAWTAAELPSLVGRVHGATQVVSPDRDNAGFVMYGPYQRLTRGTWEATVTLPELGAVRCPRRYIRCDPTTAGERPRGMSEIRGTMETGASTDPFSVHNPSWAWEFRAWWNGVGDLTVTGVSVQSASLRPGGQRGRGAAHGRPLPSSRIVKPGIEVLDERRRSCLRRDSRSGASVAASATTMSINPQVRAQGVDGRAPDECRKQSPKLVVRGSRRLLEDFIISSSSSRLVITRVSDMARTLVSRCFRWRVVRDQGAGGRVANPSDSA